MRQARDLEFFTWWLHLRVAGDGQRYWKSLRNRGRKQLLNDIDFTHNSALVIVSETMDTSFFGAAQDLWERFFCWQSQLIQGGCCGCIVLVATPDYFWSDILVNEFGFTSQKICPHCKSSIDRDATVCSNCTRDVPSSID